MTKHTMYLRRANEVAKAAREAGNTPFGAVLVNGAGEVVMEQGMPNMIWEMRLPTPR